MNTSYHTWTLEQFGKVERLKIDGPMILINLFKLRPGSREGAYKKFEEQIDVYRIKHGGRVVLSAPIEIVAVGGEEWDEIVMVEFPSKEAYLEMIAEEGFPHHLRNEFVADMRLMVLSKPKEFGD